MNGSTRPYRTTSGERWEYVLELGRAPNGRRQQVRRRGFLTEADAIAAMQAELTDRRRGQFIEPNKTTLGDYLQEWYTVIGPTRTGSTQHNLHDAIRRAAPIHHIALGKLQHHHIQGWINGLSTTFAPRTVRVTGGILTQALAQAVTWGHIARNPATRLIYPSLPPRREHAQKAWTSQQTAAFLASVSGSPLEPMWRILLDAQLRIGEALALYWSDIDLDRGIIQVRRTVTKAPAGQPGVIIGATTKTPESRRDITISPETVAALRRQRSAVNAARLAAGPAWHNLNLVFPHADGSLASTGYVNHQLEHAIAAVDGLPKLSPHGLRHTGATLLVLAGVPLVVVSRRLGHKSINTTADFYSHVTMDADRAASDALARLLNA